MMEFFRDDDGIARGGLFDDDGIQRDDDGIRRRWWNQIFLLCILHCQIATEDEIKIYNVKFFTQQWI